MSRTLLDVFPRRKKLDPADIFGPAEDWPAGQSVAVLSRDGNEVYVVKGGWLRRKRWVRR